jgi:hypothetical protein
MPAALLEFRPASLTLCDDQPVRGLATTSPGQTGDDQPGRQVRKGAMTFTSVNPDNPADVIGEWEAAGEREVAAVVERARQGADTWRRAWPRAPSTPSRRPC